MSIQTNTLSNTILNLQYLWDKCLINNYFIQGLELVVHSRGRKTSSLDEMYLGVHEELLYALKTKPVEGMFFYWLNCLE